MRRFIDTVQDRSGNAISGATVTVRVAATPAGSGALATIYSDNGVTVIAGSAVTSDASGTFSFYAPDGRYDFVVTHPTNTTKILGDVEIADLTEAFSTDATWLARQLDVDTVRLDRTNADVTLTRVAANVAALGAGDSLASDTLLLDRTNRDVSLTRSAANKLKLATGDSFELDEISAVGEINNILFVDGVKYAKSAAGINLAIADAPAGATIVLPPETISISAQILINKSLTLAGAGWGSVLQKGFNGHLIAVESDNVTLSDFKIAGVSSTFTGRGIIFFKAATTLNRGKVIRVWTDDTAGTGIFARQIVDYEVSGCRVTNVQGSDGTGNGIQVQGASKGIRVTDNFIDLPNVAVNQDGIAMQSVFENERFEDVTIKGNTIYVGPTNAFGIELGTFPVTTTLRPRNLSIVGNVIKATADCLGGISVVDVDDVAIVGNTIRSNGFTMTIGGIEVVDGDGVTVKGNAVRTEQTGNPFTGSTNNANLVVQGNVFAGAKVSVASTATPFRLTVSTADTIKNVSITDNLMIIPANISATKRNGIWLQCNNSSAVYQDTKVSGNVIISNDTTSTDGIVLERNSGTMQRVTVTDNYIFNTNRGVVQSAAGSITSLLAVPNRMVGVNTPYVNISGLEAVSDAFRFRSVGTALVAGDFALSAGWGSTASVGTITGTDQGFRATITSAGTGQAANPTVTLTFKDGTWTNSPIFAVSRGGGSQPTVQFSVTSVTATTLQLTFNGTPVDTETYTFSCVGIGR